ncbi:hypothetical protein GALL_525890 [mine drainage metagenome]|uniref:Uncharacterized protein n=1 Tax=mine drainage metagenome TaxID=410659 RepID=A0A1J5P2R3_9ZZZZ
MLERLEMQVRRPHVDRVNQHFLQKAHHRCVIDLAGLIFGFGQIAAVAQISEIELLADECRNLVVCGLTCLVDQSGQLVVFDDDQFDGGLRLKLDLVFRLVVCRICGGHHQTIAPLEQRQDLVGLNDLGIDCAWRDALLVESVQVEQGQGKCLAHPMRKICCTHGAAADQRGDEAASTFLRAPMDLLHQHARQQLGLHEGVCESGQGR